MRFLACVTFLTAALATTAYANTEKVIFVAPSSQTVPHLVENWDRGRPRTLTPANPSLRRTLPVSFASGDERYPSEHWYLLRTLNSGQRYEVRICWAAIQPTDFRLEVFTIAEILTSHPKLFASSTESPRLNSESQEETTATSAVESILALRIQAAADFFTTNKTLMQHPPPVHVDIILDPYLANIFPRSLLPTGAYISILAIVGWYVSGIIWTFLKATATTEKIHPD